MNVACGRLSQRLLEKSHLTPRSLVVGVASASGDDKPVRFPPRPGHSHSPSATPLPGQRRAFSDVPSRAVSRFSRDRPQQAHAAGGVQEKTPDRSAPERREERLVGRLVGIGTGDHDIAALASPFQDGHYPRQTLRLGATRQGSNLAQPSAQPTPRLRQEPLTPQVRRSTS